MLTQVNRKGTGSEQSLCSKGSDVDLLIFLAIVVVIAGACFGAYLYFGRQGKGRG